MKLASLYYGALQVSGLTALARRFTNGGVVLCYHNVAPEAAPDPDLGVHMPLPTFERQMRWLVGNYHVAPLPEFVARLAHGESLRGVAAITFDDGYRGVFDHAWPLLQELGIPATVFVVAEAPEHNEGFWWDDPLRRDGTAMAEWCRPAGWQTITEAAKAGLEVGVHSVTHRSLQTLDDRELSREVVESRDVIRRDTGVTPRFFAYPYGLWSDRVRDAVRDAGYRAAFTLEYGFATAAADQWALPRVNVPAGIGDAAYRAWIAGMSFRRGDGQ